VIDYLVEKSYSISTLRGYRIFYRNFNLYLEGKGLTDFSKEKAFVFIDEQYERTESISRNYRNSLERYVHVLFEFHIEGTIKTKRFAKSKPPNLNYLQKSFDLYIAEQMNHDLSPRTIITKSNSLKQFFLYLENEKTSLKKLCVDDVYNYLQTKKNYAVSSREGMLYTLRDALRFFSSVGICGKELGKLFPQISTHSEKPIPSCFSAEELTQILSAVDRTTAIGKRDYAMLLLASFLGMRVGDIKGLKISSIKWASESIEFTQSKTKRFLQLPLLPEIKFAILDYMKNARPKKDYKHLFLKHVAPYTPLSNNDPLYHVLKKYLGNIELRNRKCGMHSLRFTAAGNMLSNGIPITTICDVLGHTYYDSTKKYLAIDVDNLRKAAVEVDA